MFKSAIRVNKITSISHLRGASLHAQRHDETGRARVREGAEPGAALAWAKGDNDRDYLAAFKAHKAETRAGERKGAPLALQALCVVSPEWVEKAGDLHDPENPHNRQLFAHAKVWAESWAGEGSVFGARLDLDEAGGAVVDLMIAPVRGSRGKPVISTNKALHDVKLLTGERNEYSALQTSWAEHCARCLDPQIERGTRKEITRREHLSPETYGRVMDKARESLSVPLEDVQGAIAASDLSVNAAEALMAALTLKGEVARHKDLGDTYTPPYGPLKPEEVQDILKDSGHQMVWPMINTGRQGAVEVLDAASAYGCSGYLEPNEAEQYEAGKNLFATLADRMHLAAVVAKCGKFCAQMEARVKEWLKPGLNLDVQQLWPYKADEAVEIHSRNLNQPTVAEQARESSNEVGQELRALAEQLLREMDQRSVVPEPQQIERSSRDIEDDGLDMD